MKVLMTWLLLLLVVCVTVACSGTRGQRLEDIPTPADINALATAQLLTQNAPPPGFRDALSFPQVDQNLDTLPGWRYAVTLQFDGTFSRTPRTTTGSANAEVSYNQLGTARRVVISTAGELLGRTEDSAYEAVRLGPDAYLVQDGACLENAGDDAALAANLRAGELIGGVNRAVPDGQHATINGEDSYRFAFTNADLNLPTIQVEDGGTMNATGELWIAPEHNVVVRFYATVDVTNARVFGRTLPVDGRAIIRYDLYDVGTTFNITQPFGC